MSDIFREVDEEVRQEQVITFLKRYGKYLAAVIVLAIALVAGYRYLETRQHREHAAQGDAAADAFAAHQIYSHTLQHMAGAMGSEALAELPAPRPSTKKLTASLVNAKEWTPGGV